MNRLSVLCLLLLGACGLLPRTEKADPAHRDMVLLPGGTFHIGTDSSEVAGLRERFQVRRWEFYAPELPGHIERVEPFWMDRTEVTNEAFARFLESVPEWQPGRIHPALHNGQYLAHWQGGIYPESTALHPVTNVSWYAASAYCEWRGGRLPTEAEWEYAAQSGRRDGEFPWGDEMPDTTRANYEASGLGGPTNVGKYPPNAAGLYDMAGNVWEYVLDEWRDDYRVPRVLPGYTSFVRTRRVIRGGSWGGVPINLRTRFRDSHPPEGAGPHVGFRCAEDDQHTGY